MNNKQGEAMTCEAQYKKFNRALRFVLNTDISKDDYLAIMQLMIQPDNDACLILDNSHEET